MTFGLGQGVLVFTVGLGVVLFSAEQLVDGVERTAERWQVTGFAIAAVVVGFDPENLFVGAAGSYEGVFGFAMGSILGALMVAVGLAFGLTALFVPLEFERVHPQVVILPLAAAGLLWFLSLDGVLSRWDGAILIGAFTLAVYRLYRSARQGMDLHPPEASTVTTPSVEGSPTRAPLVLLGSLGGILLGSEMVVRGARPFLSSFGVSDTVFGMTALALLMSVEELARELPAALRGRPDITVGNVLGSVVHFLLLNAGLIAIVRPVQVDPLTRRFHFPAVLVTLLVVVVMVWRRRVGRVEALVLLGLYGGFVAGSFWF